MMINTFGDERLRDFPQPSNNNTIIQENSNGNFVIKGTNLFLQSRNSENFLKEYRRKAELYYDNSKKFETTGYC